jgi:hypothetical protein
MSKIGLPAGNWKPVSGNRSTLASLPDSADPGGSLMTGESRALSKLHLYGITLLALLILAFLLWSEVGLKRLLPTGEVWNAYRTVSTEPDEVLISSQWPNRPLRWMPHWIPYQIDTDSFLGYNIYIVLLFILRGTGVYLLLRQLFKRSAFIPIAATAIYMVYPAGTGWFSFRALTNQTATVIGYYALWLLLLYWNQPRRWLWPLIWAVQVISLLTYEQMYGVFAVAPALFWWIERRITLDWRFWRVTGLWYLSLLPTALYFVYIISSDEANVYISRQVNKLDDRSIPDMVADNFLVMFQEHFTAWAEQLGEIDFISRHMLIALLAGLVFAAVSWLTMRYHRMPPIPAKQSGLLLIGGILFMAISFAHYSLIWEQFSNRLRVYFVTTLGAALVLAVLLDLLRRVLPDSLIAGLLAVFVAIGAVDVQQQLRLHADEGMEIQRLVAPIVEQVHTVDGETTILVIDEGQRFTDPLFFARSHHLQNTLFSIYKETPRAYMCSITPSRDQCVFKEELIELHRERSRGDRITPIAYDNLLIFRTLPGTKVEFLTEIPPEYYTDAETLSYDPRSTVTTDGPLPDHLKDWFACWELKNCEW